MKMFKIVFNRLIFFKYNYTVALLDIISLIFLYGLLNLYMYLFFFFYLFFIYNMKASAVPKSQFLQLIVQT